MITFTDTNFQKEVLQNTQITLVDFWATWCGPCRIIAPIIENLAKKYAGKVTVGKLDIDTNQKITADFNIRSIPTLILFHKSQELERIIGLRTENEIEAIIEKHLQA